MDTTILDRKIAITQGHLSRISGSSEACQNAELRVEGQESASKKATMPQSRKEQTSQGLPCLLDKKAYYPRVKAKEGAKDKRTSQGRETEGRKKQTGLVLVTNGSTGITHSSRQVETASVYE